MDEKEQYKFFLEAGGMLAIDPKAQVICPKCGNGFLKVLDVPFGDSNKIDRYMIAIAAVQLES